MKLQFEGEINWSETELNFLKSSDIDIKNTTEFCELYAAQMCAFALSTSHTLDFKRSFTEIPDLLQSGYFEQPYLIRCRPEHSSNIHWPSASGPTHRSPSQQQRHQHHHQSNNILLGAASRNSDMYERQRVPKQYNAGSDSSSSSSSSSSDSGSDVSDRNGHFNVYPNLNENPPVVPQMPAPLPPPSVPQQQQPPAQMEAVKQDIDLLEQQIEAETKALNDMATIQSNIPNAYLSEFMAIQQEFQSLHSGFSSLKACVVSTNTQLSENQLKEAQMMADKHSELSGRMEALVAKINAGPTGSYDAPTEEIQREGNRQIDLLNRQLASTSDGLRRMESIRHLITPQLQERYNGIYQAIQMSYNKFFSLKEHIMSTHQILDDSQLQEAQQYCVYFSSAWTDMSLLCQELR